MRVLEYYQVTGAGGVVLGYLPGYPESGHFYPIVIKDLVVFRVNMALIWPIFSTQGPYLVPRTLYL